MGSMHVYCVKVLWACMPLPALSSFLARLDLAMLDLAMLDLAMLDLAMLDLAMLGCLALRE